MGSRSARVLRFMPRLVAPQPRRRPHGGLIALNRRSFDLAVKRPQSLADGPQVNVSFYGAQQMICWHQIVEAEILK